VPRLTLSTEQLMIFDDVLPENAFEDLLKYANGDTYKTVHAEEQMKAWRLGDGRPLKGTSVFFRPDGTYAADEQPHYPTQTPLDAFIRAVRRIWSKARPLIGDAGTAWNELIVTPWVYPCGAGFSLHIDHRDLTGTFTFYIHREWNFHWGGHLLVLDPKTGKGRRRPDFRPAWLSETEEAEFVSEPGLATCILPKPNRLIFIPFSVHHMVTRVDPNAGSHPRVSLNGLFMRPISDASN